MCSSKTQPSFNKNPNKNLFFYTPDLSEPQDSLITLVTLVSQNSFNVYLSETSLNFACTGVG